MSQDIVCSCVPLSLITLDIKGGRNPFGRNDQCFQVDSEIVSNSSINGKVHKIHHFKII